MSECGHWELHLASLFVARVIAINIFLHLVCTLSSSEQSMLSVQPTNHISLYNKYLSDMQGPGKYMGVSNPWTGIWNGTVEW